MENITPPKHVLQVLRSLKARGYVAYLGTKPEMNEIMARNIPAERMEQGPQMGGLT